MTNAEIQVNEFVRTKDGDIFKVADFYEKDNIYTMVDEKGVLFGNPRKVAKKHSFNIIDLIEVGDYVNGVDINFIDRDKSEVCHDAHDMLDVCCFHNDEIRTIVTHEQFKAMEYKAGGEDD